MKHLLYYLKSNKGSGVVTVMLAMLFLTAFGTLSLYLSYTQVKLGVAERNGMESEVNAYTCMDEVRAGVQQLTSEAISDTYTAVMPMYSKENQNISEVFKEEFGKIVVECKYKIKDSDDDGYTLFTDNATKYDIRTLEQMVREDRDYTVDIYTGSGSSVIGKGFGTEGKGTVETTYEKDSTGGYVLDEDGNKKPLSFTLKDITLQFTGKDGYKTSVTTDIVIECPDVGYLLTQYSIKGIPYFAMVATGAINQTIDNGSGTTTAVTVNGDVYAGEVNLNGDSTFKVKNYSTFICKGTINVNGNNAKLTNTSTTVSGNVHTTSEFKNATPRIEFDQSSTLWAGNIKFGSMTSAAFYGTTYFKNNFEFAGTGAQVKVGQYFKNTFKRTGSLYGFGSNSENFTDYDGSSAIIANRENNKMYIGELGSLTIAGYSYISDQVSSYKSSESTSSITRKSLDDDGVAIRMGESVSSINNQLAYYANEGKVVYYEYKLSADGDKINSTGHYIEGEYPNCKYYSIDTKDDGTTEKIYYNEEYSPETEMYTMDQIKMAVISDEDFAKIVKFALVGETYKWEDGKFVIDETAGTDGYSNSLIDDSLTENSFSSDPSIDIDDTLYQKTFADYHIHLHTIYENISGDRVVVHFYLKFATPEDSNKYFVAYFYSNKQTIRMSMLSYLSMPGLDSSIANTASGSIYTDDSYNDITAALTQTIEEIRKNAEFIADVFNNYCTTLTNEEIDESDYSGKYDSTNPFDTYVYRESIEAFSTDPTSTVVKEFKNSDGELVALMVKGDYNYTESSADTICLIVATGDVNVSDDFNGLILSNSDINIKSDANFSQNYEAILSAFQASCVTGEKTEYVKDYFKRNITKDYTIESDKTVQNVAAYDVSKMVYYDNWTQ